MMDMEENSPVRRVELYEAFAVEAGGGNPAGIVLEAQGMSEHEMLSVARDVGASETAFVTEGDAPHTYRLRYFSPEVEVPFCGHATIATAIALAEHRDEDDIVMLTRAGRVPVQIERRPDGLHAAFTSVPPTVTTMPDDIDAAALAALRWAPGDLNSRFPAAVSDAGSRHLLLAVSTRERLARLDYDFDALRIVLSGLGDDCPAVLVRRAGHSQPQPVSRRWVRGGPCDRIGRGRSRRIPPPPRSSEAGRPVRRAPRRRYGTAQRDRRADR